VKFIMERDACDDKIKVLLEIDGHEWMRAQLDHFDKLLIRDCEGSEKASDKLLMLETIVRRIEQGEALPQQEGKS
jgi:hypothetical protein